MIAYSLENPSFPHVLVGETEKGVSLTVAVKLCYKQGNALCWEASQERVSHQLSSRRGYKT